MKTTIIRLEAHDDHVSVRDKMGWAKTGRVLLVWPRRGARILRPLDLKILAHYARRMGIPLGLVSRQGRIVDEAWRLGLPVFESILSAQQADWSQSEQSALRRHPRADLYALRKQRPSPRANCKPSARLLWFGLGVLAIFSLIIFFFPSAEISLPAATRTRSVDIHLPLQPSASSALPGQESLPLRTVRIVLDETRLEAVNGTISVPIASAEGPLQITNLSEMPLDLPRGTIFHSADGGLRVETLTFAHLEPGGNLSVAVRALTTGEAGNQPAETTWLADGWLGASLAATNPQALQGGANALQRGPSQAERAAIRTHLLADMQNKAQQSLAEQLSPHDMLLPETLKLDEIYYEELLPPPGQPGQHLHIAMRAAFTANYIAAEDLIGLARQRCHLPEQDFTIRLANRAPVQADSPILSAELTCIFTEERDMQQIFALVRGQTPERAAARLEAAFNLPSTPRIRLHPAWWPRLPWNILQIERRTEP